MKKRIGNIGLLFSGFLIFALVSGVVSFFVLHKQYQAKEDTEKQIANLTEPESKKVINNSVTIQEVLEDVEEVYLECYLGSNDIIEVKDKDMTDILRHLEDLSVTPVLENTEQVEAYEDCVYAIHIKNKNIKIKINDDHIVIDDVQKGIQVLTAEERQIKAFKKEIESIYMKNYNTFEPFENPKSIFISADDEGKEWKLREAEKKELLEKLHLTKPLKKEEMVGIPHMYPDYLLRIKINKKEYKVHLVTKEVLAVDTSDGYSYYAYDPNLWEYVEKKYAVKFNGEENIFKDLLAAQKVVVDDSQNQFDFEDDTYYHIELPRYLSKMEKKETTQNLQEDKWLYTLHFTLENDTKEVKIYEHYIVCNGKTYYSEKVGEMITSLLNIP
ncbi:hypothetical protein QBE52_17485 [Clostridiaceae bacterium 35-E11]